MSNSECSVVPYVREQRTAAGAVSVYSVVERMVTKRRHHLRGRDRVVPTRADVDSWHTHLAAAGSRIQLTDAHHSSTFDVYAFNYYDTDKVTGLGCYRFEVQSFDDPEWPEPGCASSPPPQGFVRPSA